MANDQIVIDYYTDILCVWAYVAQIRVDEVKNEFGDDVVFKQHFFSLFGDTETRIGVGWAQKGGFKGFHDHVAHVCELHPHLKLHKNVWSENCRPLSSAQPHLIIQSVQLLLEQGLIEDSTDKNGRSVLEQFICNVRKAFFEQGKNISDMSVLMQLAEELSIDPIKIQEKLNTGESIALHSQGNEQRHAKRLEGSPTFILDNGRQKLYGNVGYKVIEANIQELMKREHIHMSWC